MSIEPSAGVTINALKKLPIQEYWRWWSGTRICVYGPGFSGKSTFIDYITKGILPNREENTKQTKDFEKRRMFEIKYVADNGPRTLIIRYIEDSPGQSDPEIVVAQMLKDKPNFVFFVFDISRPLRDKGTRYDGAADWLDRFVSVLRGESHRAEKTKKNLKGIGVILSKCDKMQCDDFEAKMENLKKEIIPYFEDGMQPYVGCGKNNAEYFYCSFIKGAKLSNSAVDSQHREAIAFMFRHV